jgi:hypothetical protein
MAKRKTAKKRKTTVKGRGYVTLASSKATKRPIGACFLRTRCANLTEAECRRRGGRWMGADTRCGAKARNKTS